MKLKKLSHLLAILLLLGLSACERPRDDDDSATSDDDDSATAKEDDSVADDDDSITDDDDSFQMDPKPTVICGLDADGDGTTEAIDLPVGQASALSVAEAAAADDSYYWITDCFTPHSITLSPGASGGWLLSAGFTQNPTSTSPDEAQLQILFGASGASTLSAGEWNINEVHYTGRMLDTTLSEQQQAVELHLTGNEVYPPTLVISNDSGDQFSGRLAADFTGLNYFTVRLVFRDLPIDAAVIPGDDDDSTPDTGACASYMGQATPAEIQATPRADTNLEALAISMAGTLTAPQAVYDRVVTDIDAIRTMMTTIAPGVSTISYRAPDDMRSLMMGFDSANLASVQAGAYTDWDCPNQWYEMQQIDASSSYVLVEFEGIYNIPMLAAEYATLLGVQYAEPNSIVGGGGTICGTIDGDTWHFVLMNCLNPSPAGCIGRDYYYFTTTSTTAPVAGGEWSNSSGTTAPAWQTTYACY